MSVGAGGKLCSNTMYASRTALDVCMNWLRSGQQGVTCNGFQTLALHKILATIRHDNTYNNDMHDNGYG